MSWTPKHTCYLVAGLMVLGLIAGIIVGIVTASNADSTGWWYAMEEGGERMPLDISEIVGSHNGAIIASGVGGLACLIGGIERIYLARKVRTTPGSEAKLIAKTNTNIVSWMYALGGCYLFFAALFLVYMGISLSDVGNPLTGTTFLQVVNRWVLICFTLGTVAVCVISFRHVFKTPFFEEVSQDNTEHKVSPTRANTQNPDTPMERISQETTGICAQENVINERDCRDDTQNPVKCYPVFLPDHEQQRNSTKPSSSFSSSERLPSSDTEYSGSEEHIRQKTAKILESEW